MRKKFGFGLIALSLLSGCASQGTKSTAETAAIPVDRATQYTYQDPESVPQEKWSQAMVIAREMGIYGIQDVVAPDGIPVTPQGQVIASQGVDPLIGGALGAASPTTHISGGASLALGAAFFVLGGGGGAVPHSSDQVAFWVPEDMAATAEEANKVAVQAWDEAREKAFKAKRFKSPGTMKHPQHHTDRHGDINEKFWSTAKNELLRIHLEFSEDSKNEISIDGMSGRYYGPIFIENAHWATRHDKTSSGLSFMDYYTEIAKYMPSWSAIYFSQKHEYVDRQRVAVAPATVVRNGEVMHFVVPAD